MTLVAYAHALAARVPAMAEDCTANNAYMVAKELEELFKQLRDQDQPALRSSAERELEAVRTALAAYPLLPEDCWIGNNSENDKVLWLVTRLVGTENYLKALRQELEDQRVKREAAGA